MSGRTPSPRAEIGALIARRDELDAEHLKACGELESAAASGLATVTIYRRCAKLFDERAALQLRIDERLAAGRVT